jgi:hypothetical protein
MIQSRFCDHNTHAEYGCYSNGYQYVLKFQKDNGVSTGRGQSIAVMHTNSQKEYSVDDQGNWVLPVIFP